MKYTLPILSCMLFITGCNTAPAPQVNTTNTQTPEPEIVEKTETEHLSERIHLLEEQMFYLQRELRHTPIVTPDESAAAKKTLIKFFDLVSQKKFDEAIPLLSTESNVYGPLYQFNPEGTDSATLLSSYCESVGTCLKARVLKVSRISNYDYEFTVQFINPDGTTYVFGPCCGATEEDMPSKDTFIYIVRKDFEDKMVVMTLPLYRP